MEPVLHMRMHRSVVLPSQAEDMMRVQERFFNVLLKTKKSLNKSHTYMYIPCFECRTNNFTARVVTDTDTHTHKTSTVTLLHKHAEG